MINIKQTFELRALCCLCLKKFTLGNLESHVKKCISEIESKTEEKIYLRPEYEQLFSKIKIDDFNFSKMSKEKYIEEFNKKALEAHKEYEEILNYLTNIEKYEIDFLKIQVFIKKGKVELTSIYKYASSIFIHFKDIIESKKNLKIKDLFCFLCGRNLKFWGYYEHFKTCAKTYVIDKGQKNILTDKPNFNLIYVVFKEIGTGEKCDFNYVKFLTSKFNIQSENIYKLNKAEEKAQKEFKGLIEIKPPPKTINEKSNRIFVKKLENKEKELNKQYLGDDKSNDILVKCFMCGNLKMLNNFDIHYNECKIEFHILNEKENVILHHPDNFDEFMEKLISKKLITEDIQNFNILSEKSYRENISKLCINCERKFLPESYEKHIKGCKDKFYLRNKNSIELKKEKNI